MHQTSLLSEEIEAIQSLLNAICAEYGSVGDSRLVAAAPGYANELPSEVREFLEEFRSGKPSAVCVLSGFPVDDAAIGPTPAAGSRAGEHPPTLRQEVFFLLCASLLGDVHAGAMTDAVPAKDRPERQLPAGTGMSLCWSTVDGAGPVPPAYVGYLCLRNPDDVATTVCDADWLDWARLDVERLFRPEFPDRPVLSGDPARPYLALDPAGAERDRMAPDARAAYDALARAVDTALSGVVLWPGDVAFVDNRRAVHGEEPFEPRHDGTDRWLKRLTVAGRST